jgi:hypothetical protein
MFEQMPAETLFYMFSKVAECLEFETVGFLCGCGRTLVGAGARAVMMIF